MVELRRKHDVYEEVPYQTDGRRTTTSERSGFPRADCRVGSDACAHQAEVALPISSNMLNH